MSKSIDGLMPDELKRYDGDFSDISTMIVQTNDGEVLGADFQLPQSQSGLVGANLSFEEFLNQNTSATLQFTKNIPSETDDFIIEVNGVGRNSLTITSVDAANKQVVIADTSPFVAEKIKVFFLKPLTINS